MQAPIEFHFLELPRLHATIGVREDPLANWALFIRSAHELKEAEMAELEKKDPVFEKAHRALSRISQDELARIDYDLRQAAIWFGEHDRWVRERDAREAGLAEGMAAGRAEGELKSKLETARRMLERRMDLALVLELTGLSRSDLAAHGIELQEG